MATAQTSLEIANYNFAYADTLYRYAQGRYNIGTITENEMLQLELNKLTEQTNCLNAQIEVDDYIQSLRSYLGISENINLVVIPDDSIPHFTVDVNEAMQLAFQNNPDISAFERRRLQSESNVAEAKAICTVRSDAKQRKAERILPRPDGPAIGDIGDTHTDIGLGRR